MEPVEDVARRWRERAVELRALARTMDHPSATQDLLDLALRWDLMAKNVEERAKLTALRMGA